MRIATTQCNKYGQPEFSLALEQNKILEADIQWLVRWLESEVAAGKRFKSGETIQIGWMLTKVESFEDGMLKVCEPDMVSFPIKFIDSVTTTLNHLRFQKMVAESVGVADQLLFSPLNHSAISCNWFKEHIGFFMERFEPKGSDSGWFIGCDDPNHDHQNSNNLERKSLYELITRCEKRIMQYLALPTGISVYVRDGAPSFYREQVQLPILPNSYLAASLSQK
jgi:hypothetical protein